MSKPWGVMAIAATALLTLIVSPAGTTGRPQVELSNGQTLHVAVYSHIYWGKRARSYNLACTLSVRNTDMSDPIRLMAVDDYDTQGKFLPSAPRNSTFPKRMPGGARGRTSPFGGPSTSPPTRPSRSR
jgi:hypothetical protein